MTSMFKTVALLLALGGLTACASPPLKVDEEVSSVAFSEAVSAGSNASGQVLWGGVILNTANLEGLTKIEVLAYPLDRIQRPMRERQALGRFLLVHDGFLEPLDYAEGRLLTVYGALNGITEGSISEVSYEYPTVDSGELHLWSSSDERQRPRFTFGIGVNLSN